jgi:hypothetical protein
MLRTRGVRTCAKGPFEGMTNEESAGHLKIPADLPQ